MASMVYQWKTGSIHKVPAPVAGAEMDRLAAEGRLTPSELVNENRSEDAPLHSEFEWDDSVAAKQYREVQAGNVIRHIVRVVVNEKGEENHVRKFFVVDHGTKIYEPVELILHDEDKTAMLLDQAKRELKAFKAKYACLEELASVMNAIDNIT